MLLESNLCQSCGAFKTDDGDCECSKLLAPHKSILRAIRSKLSNAHIAVPRAIIIAHIETLEGCKFSEEHLIAVLIALNTIYDQHDILRSRLSEAAIKIKINHDVKDDEPAEEG